MSNIFRQCVPKYKCNSSLPCKDLKLHLWKKRTGLFVSDSCQPQCCLDDFCNHPTPTSKLSGTSTHRFLTTTTATTLPMPPTKCFVLEPVITSQFSAGTPHEKNCSKNGHFDSCFSLRAHVLTGNVPGHVTEKAEWRDCAINERDCNAIANKCANMKHLATRNGAYLVNCTVSCCDKDLCNRVSTTRDELEIKASSRGKRKFPLFTIVSLVISFMWLL